MDEYLSKPLQPNHLIQTILKCATLGGPLLEKTRQRELASQAFAKSSSHKEGPYGMLRPGLEGRSFTTREPMTGTSLASPALITADEDDPMIRARQDLADMRSMSS
jgi:osomolarity two-component system sensor histidine kinase NIK1